MKKMIASFIVYIWLGLGLCQSSELPTKPVPKADNAAKPIPPKPRPGIEESPIFISIPPSIVGDPTAFIQVNAITTGTEVQWDTPDSMVGGKPGLSVFPGNLLVDKKATIVSGSRPGKYRLWAWTSVGGKATAKVESIVTIKGEQPPPEPPPGPKPPGPTPPEPAPIPIAKGFRVLIVSDGNKNTSRQHINVIHSARIREYLDAKCAKENGQPGWRHWEPDQDVTEESDIMKKLWEATKGKLGELPQIVIVTDQKGETLPLPKTVEETLTLLKKYAGE